MRGKLQHMSSLSEQILKTMIAKTEKYPLLDPMLFPHIAPSPIKLCGSIKAVASLLYVSHFQCPGNWF